VDTSKEPSLVAPLPHDSFADFTHELTPAPPSSADEVNPDNPPWTVVTAFLAWIASALLLLFMPVIVLIPYALLGRRDAVLGGGAQTLLQDQTAILLVVLSTLPAHLLTLGLVWMVVTGFGKRPFWPTLGWSWSRKVGLWTSTGVAILVLVVGGLLTILIKGDPTELDQIVASSTAARISIALLATLTAPLVEEMIYRGLLYSALQRVTGTVWAVIIVSALFAGVHVYQYKNNLGVIAAITIFSLSLTLMRAYSGRLLPCYIMHLVFNGLQSVFLVLEPYMRRSSGGEQKATIIVDAAQHLLQKLI
jgi:membrane protease YdiL (CAAX protease family)